MKAKLIFSNFIYSKEANIFNENKNFLTDQVITYLGNKRSLLSFIDSVLRVIKKELSKDKIDAFDVFSGSGIIARLLKQYSNNLYVNDLEDYCKTINQCYLINKSELDILKLNMWYEWLKKKIESSPLRKDGFILKLYAPKDDNNIDLGERVFYTNRNARYIDTARMYLDEIPEPYKTLLLGPLLYEASSKNNTCGVFKGFYKNSHTKKGQFGGDGSNALKRIKSDIQIKKPVLSNYECNVHIYQGNSNVVCNSVPFVDVAYLDPPYNQHPYGSNYFMLNLINNYIEPKSISKVSGIPNDWNRSSYNKKNALDSMEELCISLKAKYILISYNSEGIIKYEEMLKMLSKFGKVKVFKKEYNVFRASRNLRNRNIHLTEYLFLLKKELDKGEINE